MNNKTTMLPIDENKVIDHVIDVYLWLTEYLNTDEVRLVGQKLIEVADRKATDVELHYQGLRVADNLPPEDMYYYSPTDSNKG